MRAKAKDSQAEVRRKQWLDSIDRQTGSGLITERIALQRVSIAIIGTHLDNANLRRLHCVLFFVLVDPKQPPNVQILLLLSQGHL